MQRVGQPEDIAATISFLCSEEAGFVSGQVIYVAGGPTRLSGSPMPEPAPTSAPQS